MDCPSCRTKTKQMSADQIECPTCGGLVRNAAGEWEPGEVAPGPDREKKRGDQTPSVARGRNGGGAGGREGKPEPDPGGKDTDSCGDPGGDQAGSAVDPGSRDVDKRGADAKPDGRSVTDEDDRWFNRVSLSVEGGDEKA